MPILPADHWTMSAYTPSEEAVRLFRAGLAARSSLREEERRQRVALGEAILRRAVSELLAIDPDLELLILFGSTARGWPPHADFDLDIAVSTRRHPALVGWALDQPLPVDLVDLDAVDAAFRAKILSTGRVLYEKP